MKFESVFFAKEGEKGLNETSATKLIATASNLKTDSEAMLRDMSFLDESMDIIGSGATPIVTGVGITNTNLHKIESIVAKCGHINGFISWLREAQKEIEKVRKVVNAIDIEEYCEIVGKTYPTAPEPYRSKMKIYAMLDVIDMMNIKDRAEYLALEAKSAQIGKLIHPDGDFDDARNELHDKINHPVSKDGYGKDTCVHYYKPSVSVTDVDDLYMKLQKQHQNYESSLNHMKSDLRKKLDALNQEENAKRRLEMNEHKEAQQKYAQEVRELTLEFNQWQSDKLTEVSKIKIAIPEKYEELLQELYNVGK